MGDQFLFITFFALAYVLATVTGWLMDLAFERWPSFALWVANHVGITLIDNSGKHTNRADNLGGLKRIRDRA